MSLPALTTLRGFEGTITLIGKPEFQEFFERLFPQFDWLAFSKSTHSRFWQTYTFLRHQQPAAPCTYMTLTPSFSSALMGLGLKGAQRIGYRGDYRYWLLTKALKKPHGKHRSEEYIQLVKEVASKDPSLLPIDVFSTHLYEWQKKPYVVVNVNSLAPSRRLPDFQWKTLLSSFSDVPLVFIGGGGDKERVEQVMQVVPSQLTLSLAGKTNLIELASILFSANGILTNDSGPAHMAALMDCPVVVFFGAGDPQNTAPLARKQLVLNQQVSCSPCLKNTCPLKTLLCLTSLDIKSHIPKIHKLLGL